MIQNVVGAEVYSVWIDMLKKLVPNGRTHRISVLVAAMLQFTYEEALNNSEKNSSSKNILEIFELAYEEHDEDSLEKLIKVIERLFKEAGVGFERINSRGQTYTIAEDSAYEFLKWENMPWES